MWEIVIVNKTSILSFILFVFMKQQVFINNCLIHDWNQNTSYFFNSKESSDFDFVLNKIINLMGYSSYSKGSLPYSKESTDDYNRSEMCRSVSWIRILLVRFIKFCEAYGSLLAYYGSAFSVLLSCIIVTVFNE